MYSKIVATAEQLIQHPFLSVDSKQELNDLLSKFRNSHPIDTLANMKAGILLAEEEILSVGNKHNTWEMEVKPGWNKNSMLSNIMSVTSDYHPLLRVVPPAQGVPEVTILVYGYTIDIAHVAERLRALDLKVTYKSVKAEEKE